MGRPGPRRLTVTDTWDPEIPTFHYKRSNSCRDLSVAALLPRYSGTYCE